MKYVGVTLVEALQLTFIIFKLLKVTEIQYWSWWWVLSPTWIPVGFVGVFCLIALIVSGIAEKMYHEE